MVGSGATVLFINKKYADSQKMWQVPLEHQICLHNIDGTLNEAGSITHKVSLTLKVSQDEEKFDFFVTSSFWGRWCIEDLVLSILALALAVGTATWWW
jgi:hypothetical protein